MNIIFRDINPDVAIAVRDAFHDVSEFDVDCGDIFSAVPADAIVSPANSFGYMDGGIDAVYLRVFGQQLQGELQAMIKSLYPNGELPVGHAVVIETGHSQIPLMISAPTMRMPGNVRHSQNAYLAFRAVLALALNPHVRDECRINTILCPGLATLTGHMAPLESARQMRAAWDEMFRPASQ